MKRNPDGETLSRARCSVFNAKGEGRGKMLKTHLQLLPQGWKSSKGMDPHFHPHSAF